MQFVHAYQHRDQLLWRRNDYVILDCNNIGEEDDANEATKNQLKVINNNLVLYKTIPIELKNGFTKS